MPSHPDRVRRNYKYKCPYCDDTFDTEKELREHIKNIKDFPEWKIKEIAEEVEKFLSNTNTTR